MYTINTADTWEKKTMTFPADTTGTWGTGNGRGILVRWSLGAGSGRLGTANQWNGSQAHGATGTTNLFATNAATCLLYTSPSPRDQRGSRMAASA